MLYLNGNSLTSVPESLGKLSQLAVLDLSDNSLTSVPESLGNLSQLTTLSLRNNELTSVPESLGKLSELTGLYLNNNSLTSVPESLVKLSQLTELHLYGNEGLGIPSEVLVSRNPREILDYYFRIRGEPQPLNEAKLILVGYGDVGKTSLVNKLVHNTFNPDEGKTPGINITQWPITLNEDENVRLHIWDFGGQEIMHSTHQFFLTERSLYLLVLNGRGGHEETDADYWLSLIQSFGNDSPVIVVFNRYNAHPGDLNRVALMQKYPFVRAFINTDCENGLGIEDLRQLIHQETDNLEHLRDSFPASWFSIKNRLASMEENYVAFSRYQEICEELGEEEEQAQESLASYLNSLGIVLNYRDDPRLRDTNVLNPRWVTSGIYTIINSKNLEENKGVLRLSELREILDSAVYPPEMHYFLMELMRKFELCFRFPDEDNRYLIPDLLDKQQPQETADLEKGDGLRFQIHYPVLPEGLFPRFVVRTHELSTDQHRWRTGVVLKFEENQAVVRADLQDKKIFINITGSEEGRRELLGIIRYDFERIHRSFKFQPSEMIPVPGYPNVLVSYENRLLLEQSGMATVIEVVEGQILEVNVKQSLDNVDLDRSRRASRSEDRQGQELRVFFSYSHKDERYRNQLETHLKILQRRNLIDVWYDRRIGAGEELDKEIDENLKRSDIILLVVSADFIASDYCYDIEVTRAMEMHEASEARVIPVIVRDVNWHSAPFGRLKALPRDGRAVTTWPNRDTAWRNVSEGIEAVVKEMRANRR